MTDKQLLAEKTIENATHRLKCEHVFGKHRQVYYMDCLPISEPKNGSVKVIVFGNRFWGNRMGDNKRIRTVPDARISKKQ